MTKEYQIEYYTHNVYESAVSEAFFEFLVAPCTDATQQIKEIRYWCSLPGQIFNHANHLGFEATNLRLIKPFKEFGFRMNARVEKALPFAQNLEPLSTEEENELLTARDFFIDHHHFLEFSRYTTIEEAYSSKIIYKNRGQSVANFLRALNRHIYGMLKFDPEPTNVHTTATEVLELGKGVCQDYTHIFLAIARRNRIPCRYVSGYLNQGGRLMGSAVMHAWAEAYIPGYGWCGFDPTNNLMADSNYIKAAHGSDYSDCSPIKGVLKTSGYHRTDYQVKVISTIPNIMEQ
jgi:hypothetical protein